MGGITSAAAAAAVVLGVVLPMASPGCNKAGLAAVPRATGAAVLGSSGLRATKFGRAARNDDSSCDRCVSWSGCAAGAPV
jgi:hypothetical protein